MNLSLILNKKFSIDELIEKLVPLALAMVLLYLLYLQNSQIIELQNSINEIINSQELLRKEILEKNAELEQLKIFIQNTTSKEYLDSAALKAKNERIQFYIKAIGVTMASVLVICLIVSIYPTAFSLKAIMPAKAYTFIQSYTPFLQEKKEIFFFDSPNDLSWLVTVINDSSVKIQVKHLNAGDYQSASDFVNSLLKSSGTMTNYIPSASTINSAATSTFDYAIMASSSQNLMEASTVASNLSNFI